jgi:hypothetical protein
MLFPLTIFSRRKNGCGRIFIRPILEAPCGASQNTKLTARLQYEARAHVIYFVFLFIFFFGFFAMTDFLVGC